ncbi:MAG: hypothetical protein ACI4V5_07980 [Prevotella sp.]
MKINLLAIQRSPRFSPNSVEKDASILKALTDVLSADGHNIHTINEDNIITDKKQITHTEKTVSPFCADADMILSMGRLKPVLEILKEKEEAGTIVINSPRSIEACNRRKIDLLMRSNGTPVAPVNDNSGWWIKRCDETAQTADDVRYAGNEDEKTCILSDLRQKGITDVLVTAHVSGDLIKFYGITGTDFFATFYPTDDKKYKFNDENINGEAHHYIYDKQKMQSHADRIAQMIGISFYGGDCIVKSDGSYVFIDFNDWPSFSRCREIAAKTMAQHIKNIINRL